MHYTIAIPKYIFLNNLFRVRIFLREKKELFDRLNYHKLSRYA